MGDTHHRGRQLLILVCLATMVVAGGSYVLLQPFPAVRVGVTLTLFGVGFIVLACVGVRTGVIGWRLGAVTREDEALFFWTLVFSNFVTGVAAILLGWVIQIHIVNAGPPRNPLPPEHPDYHLYMRGG